MKDYPYLHVRAAKKQTFWMIKFSERTLKLELEEKKAAPDSAPDPQKSSYDSHFKTVEREYKRWWSSMEKEQFTNIIGISKFNVARFYFGLHRTCFKHSWDLFYYAMTLPWNGSPTPWIPTEGSERKLKLLDIGFGQGFYLVLARLLGFECVALDLPEGTTKKIVIPMNPTVDLFPIK